jgi:hypothetical protein
MYRELECRIFHAFGVFGLAKFRWKHEFFYSQSDGRADSFICGTGTGRRSYYAEPIVSGAAQLMDAGYFVTSPNGDRLEVNRQVYVALRTFMKSEERPLPTGSVTIHFSGGGNINTGAQPIASVESTVRRVYK